MIIDTTLNNKYDKIVEAALGIKEEDFDFFVYSGLQLEKRFQEKFTEREMQVLKERHLGEKTTLKNIAEKLQISTERVRQIDLKALRKIRAFFYTRNSKLNQDRITTNFPELDYLVRKRIFENNNVIDNSIKKDFIDTYKYFVERKINDKIHDLTIEKVGEANNINYSEIKIEELELSVRTFSIAVRNGIRTLEGLIEKYYEGEFEKYRNVGKKTMEEVYRKINEFPSKYINTNEFKSKEQNIKKIFDHQINELKEKLQQFKDGLIIISGI